MASAVMARALVGARVVSVLFMATTAFVVSGAGKSWAQAPIVYAKALGAEPTPAPRLENRVEFLPPNAKAVSTAPSFVDTPKPATFDASETRAIDLRPGAMKASFGPIAPVSRMEAPLKPLAAKPVAPSTGYAEPYAGPPYQVDGKWYVPTYEPNYDEVGIASWYGPTFHGKASASGEQFDEMAMTAAHPTLPIPSLVKVTNLENGKSVIVRLNDRGPFVDDRIIDLSRAAGMALDMQAKGTAKVRVQYVGPAPLQANAVPPKPMSAPAPVLVQATTAPQVVTLVDRGETPLADMPKSPAYQPLTAPATQVSALAAAPAKLVAPAPTVDIRGFYLQVGSFADLANANALKDRLKDKGPVTVSTVEINGAVHYRVLLGPWGSRSDAEQAKVRLADAGTKAFVVAKS